MTIDKVYLSTIKVGDTVLHNNEVRTVSGTDLKHDKFMGTTLFGDSYLLGRKLVLKITSLTHPLKPKS